MIKDDPSANYSQAERIEDFGDPIATFQIAISQIGDDGLAGTERVLPVGN